MNIRFGLFLICSCFGEISDIKYLNSSLDCIYTNIKEHEIRLANCASTDNLEKIDTILQLHKTITDLSLINAKLSEIPPFICKLSKLIHLDLSFNEIIDIPEGCFKNKIELIYLNLDNNKLSKLRNGTFAGMKNLQKLSCANNVIMYIGSTVFSNVTDLSRLVEIDLHSNNLTSLDVWPIMRGRYVNNSIINVSRNRIENFTNDLSWKFTCDKFKKIKFILSLEYNCIKNFMSIIKVYFGSLNNLLCFFASSTNETSSSVDLLFNGNRMKCDCIDFPVLRLIRTGQRISMLDGVYCGIESGDLSYRKIVSLDLPELVCFVPTESHCPSECTCKKQPYNGTFHVLCSSKQISELPQILPSLKTPTSTFAQYKLVFQNNSIDYLTPRKYFEDTMWLDLSESNIQMISNETWMSIRNIKQIYLQNNKITMLPKIIIEEPGEFEKLSIYNNPIKCDCENIWFKDWLKDKREKIDRMESILCDTPYWLKGKSIIHINDEEFCTDPYYQNAKKTTFIIVFTILAILIPLIILGALVYHYRIQVNALLNIHPFDRDECTGEKMTYDVFISSSYQDRMIAIELVELLESLNYVVCYHERDFVGGNSITDNINTAILTSRRILCLISKAFLNSPTCMYEFDMALHKNIEMKCNRLILILLDSANLIFTMQLSPSFEQFIKSHTYIDYKSNKQANNKGLLYAMPINPLKPLSKPNELLPIKDSNKILL